MKLSNYILSMACVLVFAGMASAAISGSAHDFSALGWSGGSICQPCHAPHKGAEANNMGLLWNHQVPSYANYNLYESAFPYDGTTSSDGFSGLDRDSHLCMGCHDGSVALDSFGAQSTGTVFITADAQIGNGTGNLSDDHPIGAVGVYDFADTGFQADPVAAGVRLRDMTVNAAAEQVVSCASCHSVHNKASLPNLLRVTNSGSALCIACHNK